MTGQRQSFSERTYFWRKTTLDATVWGKIWNVLILVDNNVFVLQETQSINSPNLEASRLQVHFLQHVKLHVFGEDVYFDGTPTSKICLCGTENLKGQLQSFYPKCLELGCEFINKKTVHFFHLMLELSRWIRRGHFLTEYSTKFQINGACYQIIKYFQSF